MLTANIEWLDGAIYTFIDGTTEEHETLQDALWTCACAGVEVINISPKIYVAWAGGSPEA